MQGWFKGFQTVSIIQICTEPWLKSVSWPFWSGRNSIKGNKFRYWQHHLSRLKLETAPSHTHSNIREPTHWAVRFSYWSEQGSAGLANVITECNICVWPEGYRDLAAQAWPAGCRKHRLLAVMNHLGSNGTVAHEKVESNGITKDQTEAFSCYNQSALCENLIFHRFTSLGLFLWALPYCQYTYTPLYFSQTSSHLDKHPMWSYSQLFDFKTDLAILEGRDVNIHGA